MRVAKIWATGLAGVLAVGVGFAQSAGAVSGSGAAAQSGRDAGADGKSRESDLHVFFADVEGGQATLFVMPSGESLLVDTGWPGYAGRDADRIAALCKLAGVAKIDTLVLTHYHIDHAGGVPQLVAKIPVGRFIDHGINRESEAVAGGGATVAAWTAYQKVLADGHAEHLVVKPGDVLPVKGMRVEIVSADGEVIAQPLKTADAGAGAKNTACASSPVKPAEGNENDRSVGMVLTFGRLRILDLGDLTWALERGLVCPVNKLGDVDVYIVSHHGTARSGSPALVDAIAPRVAIMDNGPHKGGESATYATIEGSSRLKDLWQLHTAEASDAHNPSDSHIANLPGPDAANYLKLTGRADGSFAVTNGRTGETVEYPAH
ncbi:MAG TPA: MBL fold metallo-hydrolase [Acidobacteriaceae bacterium]|nr:MBL fold metallo-hydrolase [Acidobacteriaceae bacterium]